MSGLAALLAGDFGRGLAEAPAVMAGEVYVPAADTVLGRAHALIADAAAADLQFAALEAMLAAHDGVAQGARSLFADYAARIGRVHDDVLSGRLDTISPGEYLERPDGFLVPWRRSSGETTRIHRADGTLWILEPQAGGARIVRRALDPDPYPSQPAVVDPTLAQSAELTFSPPGRARTADRLHETGRLMDKGLDAPLRFDLDVAGRDFGPFAGQIEADGQPAVQLELQRRADGRITASATRLGRTLEAVYTPGAAAGDRLHVVSGDAVLDLVRTAGGVRGEVHVGENLVARIHDRRVAYSDGHSEELPQGPFQYSPV